MVENEIEETEKKIIDVEETNLEDLILLGDDKLINVQIGFPTKNGTRQAKAKIKQLKMKEIKNLNLNNPSFDTNVELLRKALFKSDETPYTREMILDLPIGVVSALAEKIMELSGVNSDIKKF